MALWKHHSSREYNSGRARQLSRTNAGIMELWPTGKALALNPSVA